MQAHGRIEVHAHLLPGVDDGCQTLEDSIECARQLVQRGYTHCFCTPHIWPSLPQNHARQIAQSTDELQRVLHESHIPLQLIPGGELNLNRDLATTSPSALVSYHLAARFVLIDLWADKLPEFFESSIRWLQSHGLCVILAHPERMRAVQCDPGLADYFQHLGVLLQGNFQCFSDAPHLPTRRVAEQFLREKRYFVLGSDLHGRNTLPSRFAGMTHVHETTGDDEFDRLTITNPSKLLVR